MEHAEIHIGGLDLRTPDRDAPAGTARRLQNLYPSGAPEKPIWRPVKNRTLYLEDTGYSIIALHVWYRSNFPTMLVFLAIDDSTQQLKLYGREMNADSIFIDAKTLLHDFAISYAGHTSRFTQIGDNLVVNLIHANECDDIIVIRMINGVLTSLPYNLPELPAITSPESSYPAPTGTRTRETGAKMMRFGFQYGYKLKDGSIARLSNIVIRESSADELLIPVKTDAGGERRRSGGATDVTRTGGSTRDPAPEIEYDSKGFVYFNGTRVAAGKYTVSVAAPVLDVLYKELIESIVVFISQQKPTAAEVFADSLFYEYGEIKDIFGTGTKELKIEFTLEDLLLLPILEADNLLQHGLYPVVVDSYNKMLLMGDVAIDYIRPTISGATEIGHPSLAIEPFNLIFTSGRGYYFLTWYVNEPSLLASSTVEKSDSLITPVWSPVLTDVRTTTAQIAPSDAGKAFRVKCTYSDGSVSDWTYYALPVVSVTNAHVAKIYDSSYAAGLKLIVVEWNSPSRAIFATYERTSVEVEYNGSGVWESKGDGIQDTASGVEQSDGFYVGSGETIQLRLRSYLVGGMYGDYVYLTYTNE